MSNQDDLFLLIQALSPSEKRYFKVNASNGDSKSNYLKLFNVIDGFTEYDEEKLKKKLAKEKFIKYLPAEKKYLNEQLMRSMRAYYAGRTVDTKIQELLQDELFYRDKGLNGHREKALQKAKSLAEKYERFHYLQEILERMAAYVEEFEEKALSEPVLSLLTELKQLANKRDTWHDIWSKNKEIFAMYRSGADIKDPLIKNRADILMAEVERYAVRLGNSYRLNTFYHRAHINYNILVGNSEQAYEHNLKEYELYQKFPHFKEEYAISYKICLANLIGRAHSTRKTDKFLQYIDELKTLPVTSFNEEGEVFQNVYFSEHLHHMNKGDFEKAESLIPIIEEGLVKYETKINKARLLTFQSNIMIMYFVMHRFKEAARWADIVLEDRSEIKQNINTTTRILLPIIHFELGHVELVDSFTRSAYRDLSNKKRLHQFERLAVSYLKGMPLSTDQEKFNTKLEEFSNQLQALFDDPNEKVTLGMEELQLWVKSKQTGKLMSDLLKEMI